MSSNIRPNSEGESELKESWSDSARKASASARHGGGGGTGKRWDGGTAPPANRNQYKTDEEFARHKGYQRDRVTRDLAKRKEGRTPGTARFAMKQYIKTNELKHWRDAGITKTYYKDPSNRVHIHDSKDNSWRVQAARRPSGKRRTSAQKRADNYVMYD